MKYVLLFLLIVANSPLNAQDECDCCNLYLLYDYKAWESFFTPTTIKKRKYTIIEANYSYIDSNGTAQSKPLAVFSMNRKGYVDELKEYYLGIPNHITNFDRKRKKRIESTMTTYLNEEGEKLTEFSQIFTQYSYSKNTIRKEEQYLNGEFPEEKEESKQNFSTVTYNENGLVVKTFNQYHIETGIDDEPYHFVSKSELRFLSDTIAERFHYYDDSLSYKEKITLNEDGKETYYEAVYPIDSPEIALQKKWEYNSDGQCVHHQNRNFGKGISTECSDLDNYDLYFNYENGLLRTVNYVYLENSFTITFSYH